MSDLSAETLIELLRHRTRREPDETAYIFLRNGESEETRLTYQTLDLQARSVATQLQYLGAAGERALLLYPPGPDYIVSFFGCLYAGVIAVPAYPPHPAHPERSLPRLQSMIESARPSVILIPPLVQIMVEPVFSKFQGFEKMRWLATDGADTGLASDWEAPEVSRDTLAFLQYTSGSTGDPKGVMVSHGNLMHNSAMIHECFGNTRNSRGVIWLPPYHDMGLIGGILQPLYGGFPAILMTPAAFLQKPLRWLRAISQHKATVSGGPDFAYELCIRKIRPDQRDELDLSSWEIAFNGAEPVRAETMERFSAAFGSCGFRREAFYPCYGLAEATLIVSGGDAKELPVLRNIQKDALEEHRMILSDNGDGEIRTLVGCGKKAPEQQIVIANPNTLRQCGPNEIGEIWVSGRNVAHGYWRRPDETAETFQAHLSDTGEGPFLRTGDMGFFADEELFITGRHKDLIVIRGRNHYPQDIERTVEQSYFRIRPGCSAAFSVDVAGEERLIIVAEAERRYRDRRGKPNEGKFEDADRRKDQRRKFVELPEYIPDSSQPLDVEEAITSIRKAVSKKHELYAHEVLLLKVGSIPKTSSGKIRRHACRRGFSKGSLSVIGSSMALEGESSNAEVESSPQPLNLDISVSTLLAAPLEKQREILESYLRNLAASIMKVALSAVDADHPLTNLGIDSLKATEFQHHLEADLGGDWPMIRFLDGPTIAQLVTEAMEKLESGNRRPETEDRPAPSTQQQASSLKPQASPLSHNQKSLWFMYQLAPESSAYNLFFAVRIVSGLDIPALRHAFQALISRHPCLRTVYSLRDGEPIQEIHGDAEICFEETDASAWTEDELNATLTEEAHRPFDLENGPVMRVNLFSRPPEEHVLLLNIHHIATDMWSFSIMLEELRHLYPAAVKAAGGKLPMPARPSPMVPPYPEYVRWQSEMLSGSEGERLWNYWHKQLGGELPVLNLPTDHPRPPVQTYNGTTYGFRLGRGLTQKVTDLAKDSGLTLYMTLLAAFQVLLYRYTAQEDILVGSPVAGRSRPKFKGLMGYLVNLVVMRSDLSGHPSFRAFMAKVRQTVLDALAHQDYPFRLLVERLQPDRDASRSPLFQVVFILQKAYRIQASAPFAMKEAGYDMELGGLKLESMTLKQQFSQFDLMFLMVETDDGLAGSVEYNTDLFDADTIARMTGHFQVLLEGITANPDQTILELPLLTQGERHQLLAKWNDTYVEYPRSKCLHELFEEQAEKTPSAIAVVFENQKLTYQELNDRANQLAHHLRRQGVGPDILVGICMERSLEMVVGLMGVLKAGGAYVPLDPSYPNERLAFMLEDADVPVLLAQEKLTSGLPDHRAYMLCLDTGWDMISQEDKDKPVTGVTSDHLAYVIYTSGSTGMPKGVMIPHQAICNHMFWMHETFPLTETDKVFQKTPFSFDASVWEFYAPLMAGAQLVMARPNGHQDGEYLIREIADQKITTLQLVPSLLRMLLQTGGLETCSSLKRLFCGGEALSVELQEPFFASPHTKLFNLYGPTEASIDAMFWPCRPMSQKSIAPIGRPIANTRAYILDRQLQPVPIGVSGELHIGGAGLARGYLNRPELTKEKFIPDPFCDDPKARLYKTGDLACYLPDGNMEFLGRIDHQVKIRGFRIELGEIENHLINYQKETDSELIPDKIMDKANVVRCTKCLLSSAYPDIRFDEKGVCNVCQEYDGYAEQANAYFKGMDDFRDLMEKARNTNHGEYDCMLLYSGGKDSSYVLYRLADMGLKVLTFTFDNGFISETAFENIRRMTSALGVENIIGRAEDMNDIFVDSLHFDHTVCTGCFRALTTLSTQIAHEKNINVVITGLSRGQIFETKLHGLFREGIFDADEIEEKLLLFRKMYHARNDRISRRLNIELEQDVFERMHFVDFFRYDTTPTHQVREYLKKKDDYWSQPKDTGFCSTNCLINDVGICIHLKDMGYHNYEAPLSWDIRLGRLSKEQGLGELDFSLDLPKVSRILDEIKYFTVHIKESVVVERTDVDGNSSLCAYIVSNQNVTVSELREYLSDRLPDYMVPSCFIHLDKMPLTPNGKVDRRDLPDPEGIRPEMETAYAMPRTDVEQRIVEIWQDVLGLKKVGIHDNFFDLGGHSLLMLRIHNNLKEVFNKDIPVADMFRYPSVAALAQYLDQGCEEQSDLQQAHDAAKKQKGTMMMRRKQLRGKNSNAFKTTRIQCIKRACA